MARASSRRSSRSSATSTGLSAAVSSRVSIRLSRSPPLAADVQQLLQRHHVGQRQLAEDAVQFLHRDAHLGGDLGLGGGAAELRLQRGVGTLHGAGLLPHRAGDPVQGPQLVDHRAPDAGDRVGLELDGPLGVELLDGVDQSEDPGGDEVGLLDIGRQPDADPARDVLHQRRVVQDQLLAQPLVARGLVRPPQLVERARARAGRARAPRAAGGARPRGRTRRCAGACVALSRSAVDWWSVGVRIMRPSGDASERSVTRDVAVCDVLCVRVSAAVLLRRSARTAGAARCR